MGAGDSVRAAEHATVRGIRFGVQETRTRIVIDITRRVDFKARLLEGPPRLVIDLPEVRFRPRPHPLGRPRGLATGHRFGRLEPGRSRIIVDLARPARLARAFWIPPTRELPFWRRVLDLEPRGRTRSTPPAATAAPAPAMSPATPGTGARPAAVARAAGPRIPPPPAPRPAVPPDARPVVVIDPGHGGVDPGTIGVGGLREKDLTLAMARALATELRRTGRYRVRLTREDDRFLPLRERVRIARRLGADLFISLHMDSLADRRVRGASVYTLSEEASDAEAARLAAKENLADVLAGLETPVEDPTVAQILIDLAQRDTLNKSIVFAEALVREIGRVQPLLKRTRRYAGFAVLKAPDTPSVLLELGYLSNPRDAARLADPAFRRRLAVAIRRAVDAYFAAPVRPL